MFRIERLASNHGRDSFDCGKPELNDYLRRYASQHDARGFGRTYVLAEGQSAAVLGFYTLSAGSVSFREVSEEILRKLPRHPMPVVHIGRMAIHKDRQGEGLGSLLLVNALRQSLKIADTIGIHAVEVVAKDESARTFYLKFGFKALKDDPLHLYLPISTVRKLNL